MSLRNPSMKRRIPLRSILLLCAVSLMISFPVFLCFFPVFTKTNCCMLTVTSLSYLQAFYLSCLTIAFRCLCILPCSLEYISSQHMSLLILHSSMRDIRKIEYDENGNCKFCFFEHSSNALTAHHACRSLTTTHLTTQYQT